jgi:hypothetical protein
MGNPSEKMPLKVHIRFFASHVIKGGKVVKGSRGLDIIQYILPSQGLNMIQSKPRAEIMNLILLTEAGN